MAVAGLIASFHTIIFAYGRNIYSLSRAGYFPLWLWLFLLLRLSRYLPEEGFTVNQHKVES